MKKLLVFVLLLKAFSASSQDFETLITKGDEFFEQADYPQAAKIFSEAIKADPKQSKGYWYRGDAYRLSGKYNEAIADYNTGLGLDNEHVDLWLHRGTCYAKLGDKTKACPDLKRAFELGSQKALRIAGGEGCEWVKTAPGPCSNVAPDYAKVQIDPFTGAIFIAEGLNYHGFKFGPEDELGYVSGPFFGSERSVELKFLEPDNFCVDSAGDAFFGLQFALYTAAGDELFNAPDLYADQPGGLPVSMLKSLSLTAGFSSLETGKKYVLRGKFFDKRGNGSINIEMPFEAAAKTAIANDIFTTESVLGNDVASSAVGVKAGKFYFTAEDLKTPVRSVDPKAGGRTGLVVENIQGLSKNTTYRLRMVSNTGAIVSEEGGSFLIRDNNGLFSLPATPAGNYQVWLYVQDDSGHSIGFTSPLRFN